MSLSAQPPTPGSSPGPASTRPVEIMVASIAGALVMFGVILAVLGAELVMPQTWMLIVVGVATIAAWSLVHLLPEPRGAAGASAVQQLAIGRTAILEAPAILGFALAFISQPTNLLIYVLPAIFALGGIWLFARPAAVRAWLQRRG